MIQVQYKNNYIILLNQSSITHFAIVAKDSLFCLALWRHHSWSVTSREREKLTLWRHIRRMFLQVQIVSWIMYRATSIKQTVTDRCVEGGNPSLLCYCRGRFLKGAMYPRLPTTDSG